MQEIRLITIRLTDLKPAVTYLLIPAARSLKMAQQYFFKFFYWLDAREWVLRQIVIRRIVFKAIVVDELQLDVLLLKRKAREETEYKIF